MTIFSILDSAPYSALSVHIAVRGMAQSLGRRCVQVTPDDVCRGAVEGDADPRAILIVESAVINSCHQTVAGLKKLFCPNGKIVVLGGDTIWWLRQGKDEVSDPQNADLWLDLLDEVVAAYQARGIRTDSWVWSIAQDMVRFFIQQNELTTSHKNNDFIFLHSCHPHNEWRIKLAAEMATRSKTMISRDIPYAPAMLHTHYRRSRFVLGSTSPSWTSPLRTAKGFRDWIGPACGTVLLYDDHPDSLRKLLGPFYAYDDFNSLFELADELWNDPERYIATLNAQRRWLETNNLDTQFYRLFQKHGVL